MKNFQKKKRERLTAENEKRGATLTRLHANPQIKKYITEKRISTERMNFVALIFSM